LSYAVCDNRGAKCLGCRAVLAEGGGGVLCPDCGSEERAPQVALIAIH